jgi:hypothetical protein
MNEYQKDLHYVTTQIKNSIIIDQINGAKRVLRHFEDKWSIQLSATDPTFQKDRETLNKLYQEKFTFISRAYLLN